LDCSQVFACLSADLDGELSVSEAEAVRQHVDGCDVCTRRRRLLEQTRWAARTIRIEGNGAGVARQRGDRHYRGWLAAAAVLAATIGYVAIQYVQQPAWRPHLAVDSFNQVTRVQTLLAGEWATGVSSRPGADCGLNNAAVCYVEIPCANAACRPGGGVMPPHESGSPAILMGNQ
jgi:anti-sigma factor RsiW